eukprot:UN23507
MGEEFLSMDCKDENVLIMRMFTDSGCKSQQMGVYLDVGACILDTDDDTGEESKYRIGCKPGFMTYSEDCGANEASYDDFIQTMSVMTRKAGCDNDDEDPNSSTRFECDGGLLKVRTFEAADCDVNHEGSSMTLTNQCSHFGEFEEDCSEDSQQQQRRTLAGEEEEDEGLPWAMSSTCENDTWKMVRCAEDPDYEEMSMIDIIHSMTLQPGCHADDNPDEDECGEDEDDGAPGCILACSDACEETYYGAEWTAEGNATWTNLCNCWKECDTTDCTDNETVMIEDYLDSDCYDGPTYTKMECTGEGMTHTTYEDAACTEQVMVGATSETGGECDNLDRVWGEEYLLYGVSCGAGGEANIRFCSAEDEHGRKIDGNKLKVADDGTIIIDPKADTNRYRWNHIYSDDCGTECGHTQSYDQTAIVLCQDQDGNTASDAKCEAMSQRRNLRAKPTADSRTCNATGACDYGWVNGIYGSDCPTNCDTGVSTQTAVVRCKGFLSGNAGNTGREDGVTDSDCENGGSKPTADTRECPETAACSYSWEQVYPTEECPSTCGYAGATETATVSCLNQDGGEDEGQCGGSKPAAEERTCQAVICTPRSIAASDRVEVVVASDAALNAANEDSNSGVAQLGIMFVSLLLAMVY